MRVYTASPVPARRRSGRPLNASSLAHLSAVMLQHLCGLLIVLAVIPAHASEEEFLQWSEVRIVTPEREDTGRVTFVAQVREESWQVVKIEAFGRNFSLDEEQRNHLNGFLLSSIRTTHEAGWEEVGGHTIYFKFQHTRWDKDRLIEQSVVVAVSRGQGLSVSQPSERELLRREG